MGGLAPGAARWTPLVHESGVVLLALNRFAILRKPIAYFQIQRRNTPLQVAKNQDWTGYVRAPCVTLLDMYCATKQLLRLVRRC